MADSILDGEDPVFGIARRVLGLKRDKREIAEGLLESVVSCYDMAQRIVPEQEVVQTDYGNVTIEELKKVKMEVMGILANFKHNFESKVKVLVEMQQNYGQAPDQSAMDEFEGEVNAQLQEARDLYERVQEAKDVFGNASADTDYNTLLDATHSIVEVGLAEFEIDVQELRKLVSAAYKPLRTLSHQFEPGEVNRVRNSLRKSDGLMRKYKGPLDFELAADIRYVEVNT